MHPDVNANVYLGFAEFMFFFNEQWCSEKWCIQTLFSHAASKQSEIMKQEFKLKLFYLTMHSLCLQATESILHSAAVLSQSWRVLFLTWAGLEQQACSCAWPRLSWLWCSPTPHVSSPSWTNTGRRMRSGGGRGREGRGPSARETCTSFWICTTSCVVRSTLLPPTWSTWWIQVHQVHI